MLYPFLVADRRSGSSYRLSHTNLGKFSLAPLPPEWAPEQVIANKPDLIWKESVTNAPVETIPGICMALKDLIFATVDLKIPSLRNMLESRAEKHLHALVELWREMGTALPEEAHPIRHALNLPIGNFTIDLPVIENSLDPLAPAATIALYNRLKQEFGTLPGFNPKRKKRAKPGTGLHSLQAGITAPGMIPGSRDESLKFYGLRDSALCADFAAAQASAFIEKGASPSEIAIMTGSDTDRIVRAFAKQKIPLSGFSDIPPNRDVIGETALHLTRIKLGAAPAMNFASLVLSPLMPWSPEEGRAMAENLVKGDFRCCLSKPEHRTLWNEIYSAIRDTSQLHSRLDAICKKLHQGDEIMARIPPSGDEDINPETFMRDILIEPCSETDFHYEKEAVKLWSAHDNPRQTCKYLIVTDFTDGLYPTQAQANPLFLENEIAVIRESTGLKLQGRAEKLIHGISVFDRQVQAVSQNVTFLIPWRDMSGARLQPSVGLSLVARAIDDIGNGAELIEDISHLPPEKWPVEHHRLSTTPPLPVLPEALLFPKNDLLSLRQAKDGTIRPQTPSRLETLLVSPLAWLLDELEISDMSWKPEELDIRAKGNIAHEVFEKILVPDQPIPNARELTEKIPEIYNAALRRHAPFLHNSSWDMEKNGLEREIRQAVLGWREHLLKLDAKIIANEHRLTGKSQNINLMGIADTILQLPNGELLIVDHKKSGTSGRRKRMQSGWDLQAGLYRDMIAHPRRYKNDRMEALNGRTVGIAYHLMNDSGLLTSGIITPEGSSARNMGNDTNTFAMEKLNERLAEIKKGRIVLNTTDDRNFFRNQAGFTPYALIDGPALVTVFIREPEATVSGEAFMRDPEMEM